MTTRSLAVLMGLALGGSPCAQDIHVAPGGRADAAGTAASPFATLEQARDAIRRRRAQAPGSPGRPAPVTVRVAPGTYRLARTLVLDRRDACTAWCAGPGGEVRLLGGLDLEAGRLPGVTEAAVRRRLPEAVRDRVRVIDLAARVPGWRPEKPWPAAFRGYAGWPEVVADGRPLGLARWPDRGYATLARVVDRGSRPRHDEKPDRPGAFVFREDEPTTWATAGEIHLGGYWCFSWYDEVLRVASIDPVKRIIRLAAPHRYGIGGPSGGKWYALNVLETLDRAGEFVYDRRGMRLYLLPPPGTVRLTLSLLAGPLIHITGGDSIRLQGLTLTGGRAEGVRVDGSRDVVLDRCRIHHFARQGVTVRGGRRCGLRRCTLHGLGLAGVTLAGGERATLTPAEHFVLDCRIHRYARLVKTYHPGVALAGVGHRVAYNHIHHAPHQAISFAGNDHRIEHNMIERVCQDTGDAGAIYCGRDWTLGGTRVERNWFAHLGKGAHHHNWALYPDDQASGITARHNLVVGCPSGFLFGGGRMCVIEENLFVDVGRWPIRFDARGTGWGICCEPTLLQGLAAVPTAAEPWRSRFPDLVGLAKKPKRNWPVGNRIRGNLHLRSHASAIDPKVRQHGKVETNPVVKAPAGWTPRLVDGRVVLPPGGPDLPAVFKGLVVGPRPEKGR